LHNVGTSKRGYDGLDDYAKSHGISPAFMRKAGWVEDTLYGRQCLRFPTDSQDSGDGYRARFLDDREPRHMPYAKEGYKECWYLLDRAIKIATVHNRRYLVLVGGNADVLAGQERGIPTISLTAGEKKIPQPLLDELLTKWTDKKIIIAHDSDEAGHNMAMAVKGQLKDSGLPVEMPLSQGGDFSDFCKLFNESAYDEIVKLATDQNLQINDDLSNPHATNEFESDTVRQSIFDVLYRKKASSMRITLSPIKSLHKYGGYAQYWVSQKVTMIIAPSGGGKTQFTETLNDRLNLNGVDTMLWGDEWSQDELEARRLSRHNHLTQHSILEHLFVYQRLAEDKDISGYNYINKEKIEAIESGMKRKFDESTGKTQYIKSGTTIEDTIINMEIAMDKFIRVGRRIDVVFFDYIQLARSTARVATGNIYEYIFELIKEFSIRNNIHAVITSQTTKSASQGAREDTKLTMESAHFIRAVKANQVLILNRQYYKNNGVMRDSPCYWLDVAKLSVADKWDYPMRVPIVLVPSSQYFKEYDWTQDEAYHYLSDNRYNQDGNIFGSSTR
jgi:hypothetical protein